MCGFPGVVIQDDNTYGQKSMKTVIGMVQQVKHLIVIQNQGAEASTSIVMNNIRFDDEPTDMDPYGAPYYAAPTNAKEAQIQKDTFQFIGNPGSEEIEIKKQGILTRTRFVPEPVPVATITTGSDYYDFDIKDIDPKYPYVKDILSIPASGYSQGATNYTYLDRLYEPNQITKFYCDVFGQKLEQSFMVGNYFDTTTKYFMYDTIHEGLMRLRDNNNLLTDYETAMKYVRRPVCTADQFYGGILGLSVKESVQVDDKVVTKYYVHDGISKSFQNTYLPDQYYGISSAIWSNLKSATKPDSRLDTTSVLHLTEGGFSSILEKRPLTSFIMERRKAVETYIQSVTATADGVNYKQ